MNKASEPAFPGAWHDFQPESGNQVVREEWSGMTLRDYFAAKAMQAIYQRLGGSAAPMNKDDLGYAARAAYAMANAMLAERGE